MKKVFLDSSVLVAACASKSGASALILGFCRQKKIQALVSLDVVGEARKNVSLKLGNLGLLRLAYYLRWANLVLTPNPTVEEIAVCENYIEAKDAPILASAIKSKVAYVVTLDRKHFFKELVIDFVKPMKIITPGDWVRRCIKR